MSAGFDVDLSHGKPVNVLAKRAGSAAGHKIAAPSCDIECEC